MTITTWTWIWIPMPPPFATASQFLFSANRLPRAHRLHRTARRRSTLHQRFAQRNTLCGGATSMAAEDTGSRRRDIVIIGGGIIGSTTAYFLTRHAKYDPTRHRITLLEAAGIASGASGKAGGLVALWAYPSSIVPLSYRLHEELAAEHGGAERWGYRKVHVGQLNAVGRVSSKKGSTITHAPTKPVQPGEAVSLQKRGNEDALAQGKLKAAGIPRDLDWFNADCVRGYSEMGDPSTTSQVHPYQFTTAMAQLAEEKGVKIVIGSATSIDQEDGGVKSVTYRTADGNVSTIPATDVVIAAGPWTKSLFPSAPISALRAHSVTIRPSKPISAHAIFTEIKYNGKQVSPEIYARPNNEAYACGEGDTLVDLPSTSAEVVTDLKRCQDIIDHVSSISDELRDGEVLVRQACYLPNVEGAAAGPLIGPTGVQGLFLAAGHTCWGISNGPGTGKLMSEFVLDGAARSAKIKSLDPRNVL